METRRKVKKGEDVPQAACPAGKFKVGVAIDKGDFFRALDSLTGSGLKNGSEIPDQGAGGEERARTRGCEEGEVPQTMYQKACSLQSKRRDIIEDDVPHKRRTLKPPKELRAVRGLLKLLAYFGQKDYDGTNNKGRPHNRKVVGMRPARRPPASKVPTRKTSLVDKAEENSKENVDHNGNNNMLMRDSSPPKSAPEETGKIEPSPAVISENASAGVNHNNIAGPVYSGNSASQTGVFPSGMDKSFVLGILSRPRQKARVPTAEKKPPFRRCCTHVAIAYYVQFKREPKDSSSLKPRPGIEVPANNGYHQPEAEPVKEEMMPPEQRMEDVAVPVGEMEEARVV